MSKKLNLSIIIYLFKENQMINGGGRLGLLDMMHDFCHGRRDAYMGARVSLRNKMAGDEVVFPFIQENGFFRLAPFSEVGAPGLEQASPL